MAEAIARNMGHEAMSAGTNPGSNVANNALKVLGELEVDVTGLYPKSVDSIKSSVWAVGSNALPCQLMRTGISKTPMTVI